jgi:hypothetical protein
MKFTLTYEGELRSNDDKRRKWGIRKQFHPQLQELWRVSPILQSVNRNRIMTTSDAASLAANKGPAMPQFRTEERAQGWSVRNVAAAYGYNLEDPAITFKPENYPHIDLCANVEREGRLFLPLVRNSLALKCGLKIIFLRKEEPGKVYQGGDLDNRLKTLLDALAVPIVGQVIPDNSTDYPIYCLLEDDGLITSLSVETHRLLSRPAASKHDVQLLIEVDVRVTQARLFNQLFLGE